MANHARKLVEQNGLSEVIEVIQSSVEELELPCKVGMYFIGFFVTQSLVFQLCFLHFSSKIIKLLECMTLVF